MDDQVKKVLDCIFGLFQQRQQTFDDLSVAIHDALRPTVLAAIVEVLEVDEKKVEWIDVNFFDYTFSDYSDAVLMISCKVDYDSEHEVPAILHEISPPPDPEFDEPNQRFVRVGIPFEYALQTKEEIKDMLYKTLLNELEGRELDDSIEAALHTSSTVLGAFADNEKHPTRVFDSVEWLEQLTKGTKH